MSELKQLIDYTSLYLAKEDNPEVIQEQLHNFLLRCLSIGCALNETQAVRQNEQQEKLSCCACGMEFNDWNEHRIHLNSGICEESD